MKMLKKLQTEINYDRLSEEWKMKPDDILLSNIIDNTIKKVDQLLIGSLSEPSREERMKIYEEAKREEELLCKYVIKNQVKH